MLAAGLAASPAAAQSAAGAVQRLLDATKAITVFDHVTASSDRRTRDRRNHPPAVPTAAARPR